MISASTNFLMIQYKLGHITVGQINSLIGKNLTQEEANQITDGEK